MSQYQSASRRTITSTGLRKGSSLQIRFVANVHRLPADRLAARCRRAACVLKELLG